MVAHMMQRHGLAMPCTARGVCFLPTSCNRPLGMSMLLCFQQRTALPATSAAATAVHPCTLSCSRGFGVSSIRRTHAVSSVSKRRGHRRAALPPLAMINVDFASPSLVLGITLIGCGIALLQVRNVQREVSRDADIVVAAMISIVGSTLIFQGWRLDPLLLLCQALTTSVAFWYGLETFKLRAQMTEEEESNMTGQLPPSDNYSQSSQLPVDPYAQATRSGFLPPAADRQVPTLGMMQQQQHQQPGVDATGSSRWGLPPGTDQRYDYFGQPVGQQQQPPQQQQQMYAGYEEQLLTPVYGQQQPGQYGAPGEMLGGYGSSLYMQQQQSPQQQQPFGAPSSSPGYEEGWYSAAAGFELGQPQSGQYGSVPGAAGMQSGAAAGAAAGYGQLEGLPLLPDGSVAAAGPAATGGYLADGNLPAQLPLAAGQQPPTAWQQQQQGSRAGPGAYERVDDWE